MLQQRRLEEPSNCTVKPDCLRAADCEVRYVSSPNGTGGFGQNPYTFNGDETYGGFPLPYNEIPCDSFPFKLHALLSDVEKQGLGHIASWQPHGKSFVVHNRKLFTKTILPAFFRMSKYESFQRQLNLYGFHRITIGRDRGGYYHERFVRSRVELCFDMQRVKVKGTFVRKPTEPGKDPDFYQQSHTQPQTNTAQTMWTPRSTATGHYCADNKWNPVEDLTSRGNAFFEMIRSTEPFQLSTTITEPEPNVYGSLHLNPTTHLADSADRSRHNQYQTWALPEQLPPLFVTSQELLASLQRQQQPQHQPLELFNDMDLSFLTALDSNQRESIGRSR